MEKVRLGSLWNNTLLSRRPATTKPELPFLHSLFSFTSPKGAKQDLLCLLYRITPSLWSSCCTEWSHSLSNQAFEWYCRGRAMQTHQHSGCGLQYYVKKKQFWFCGLAECSGVGVVAAFHAALWAVRSLLRPSLKTSTLNIIAVVTWAGKPHRVWCSD